MKPYFKRSLSEKFKHEWIMREWGSYEDHSKAENHVVSIIERSPKNFVVARDIVERDALIKSASYVSVGYDDDHQVAASNAIARFINP